MRVSQQLEVSALRESVQKLATELHLLAVRIGELERAQHAADTLIARHFTEKNAEKGRKWRQ